MQTDPNAESGILNLLLGRRSDLFGTFERLGHAIARPFLRLQSLPAWLFVPAFASAACALSVLFYAPKLWLPLSGRYLDFRLLCEHLFDARLSDPVQAFRMVVPTLAHYLGFRGLSVYLLQYLWAVGLVAVLFIWLRRHTDPAFAIVTTLALATSQAVTASTTWLGFQDAFSLMLIVVCLVTTWNSATKSGLLLLAMLNDERTVLAGPLYLAVVILAESPAEEGSGFPWRRATQATVPWATAGLLFIPLRVLLQTAWPEHRLDEVVGLGVLPSREHFGNTFLAWAWSFRWLWLLPLLAAPWIWRRGASSMLLVYGGLAVGALAMALVGDVSRSMGFLAPAFLVSALMIWRHARILALPVASFCLIACLLTPGGDVFRESGFWPVFPLPLVLVRAWLGDGILPPLE